MELERGMLRAEKLLAQPYELGLPASSEIKLSFGHYCYLPRMGG